MEQFDSQKMDFHEVGYLRIFRISAVKIQISLRYDNNNEHFAWRPKYIYEYVTEFFLEREMFRTKVVEKIKTPILYSVNFSENRAIYDTV